MGHCQQALLCWRFVLIDAASTNAGSNMFTPTACCACSPAPSAVWRFRAPYRSSPFPCPSGAASGHWRTAALPAAAGQLRDFKAKEADQPHLSSSAVEAAGAARLGLALGSSCNAATTSFPQQPSQVRVCVYGLRTLHPPKLRSVAYFPTSSSSSRLAIGSRDSAVAWYAGVINVAGVVVHPEQVRVDCHRPTEYVMAMSWAVAAAVAWCRERAVQLSLEGGCSWV